MPYTHVQFIAHGIHTGPNDVTGGKQEYLGKANAREDINARVALVKATLAEAVKRADTSSTALKIFQLPEFFFRGKQGAYEMDDVQYLITQLQAAAKDAKYKDWLFLYGTIVGMSVDKTLSGSTSLLGAQPLLEGYNYALLQRGGEDAGPDTAYAVMKEHKSGIDFVESKTLAGGGVALERVKHLKPVSGGARDENQRFNYDGCGVFSIKQLPSDNQAVKIGVEICLDYLEGRLASASPKPSVDVHMIPSCGAEIENWDEGSKKYVGTDRLVARAGGYAFNCDGLYDYYAARIKDHYVAFASDLRRVKDPTANPQSTERIEALVTPALVISAPNADQLYVGGAGELKIYSPQPL